MSTGRGLRIPPTYLQGNERVRSIFEDYFQPFAYLGAHTITTKNTTGTDHLPFNWVGLPGFQFIQDPLTYRLTWHTNMDVYEAASEEDLKQSVAIIASFVYHTAIRAEKLPRKYKNTESH